MKSVSKYLLCFLIAFSSILGGCSKKSSIYSAGNAEAEDDNSFRVLSFTPEGELPASVKYPSIQIQFSKPVVALKKLDEVSNSSEYVTISPALKGVYRWYGTSLLCFDCEESVIAQKNYEIKINPSTVSTEGEKISGNLVYNFHSESLRLVFLVPGYNAVKKGEYVDEENVPIKYAGDIGLFFNTKVNGKYLKKFLKVSSDSKDYNFSLVQDSDTSLNLKVTEKFNEGETISVILLKGAASDADCYPTQEDKFLSFSVEPKFSFNEFIQYAGHIADEFSNPVAFEFSAPLKTDTENELAKIISTDLDFPITTDNILIRGRYIVVHSLPVKYESTYKIAINGTVTDTVGRKCMVKHSFDVEVPAAASFVDFKDWGFKMLEAEFLPKLAFQFQNIGKDSFYTMQRLLKGNVPSGSRKEIVELNNFPKDTKIVQTVDLTPYLDITDSEYHGAIAFNSDIEYTYRYQDWDTDEWVYNKSNVKNNLVVQVTDLAASVRWGYNGAAVLVSSLKTGKPIKNAEVTAFDVPYNTNNIEMVINKFDRLGKGMTDKNGLVFVDFNKQAISARLFIEVKTNNDRIIFNPETHDMWNSYGGYISHPKNAMNKTPVTFVFTDRGLYKPGEKLTFRGIDRTLTEGEYSSYANKKFTLKLEDNLWNPTVYKTINDTTSQNGTFWGTINIPQDLKPGSYSLSYKRENGKEYKVTDVEIQFFERLRFEVNTNIAKDFEYYSGDDINAEVSASYLGGGSMNDCSYEVDWSCEPIGFKPKGIRFEKMTFGPIQGYDGRTSLSFEDGVLAGDGKINLRKRTGGEKLKGFAYDYRIAASVSDKGGQYVVSAESVTVHPAKFYIGLSNIKNVSGFPKKGDSLKFDYECVMPNGESPDPSLFPAKKGKALRVELLREEWKSVRQLAWNGEINIRYEKNIVTEYDENISISQSGELSVVPQKGGVYILRLSSKDSKGGEVITERHFYVRSSDWIWYNPYDADEIQLTPNKTIYNIGEKAEILLQSQIPSGHYLITIEREGILSQEVIYLEEPTSVISVDIKENYVPVMYVSVCSYSVRTEKPATDYNLKDLGKPKAYFGVTALHVDTVSKTFSIDIMKDKKSYKPGETATIKIRATDADGNPVKNAEVTLMAVDRGVIDLINYHVPDPVKHFYDLELFPICVRGGDSRSLLIDPVTYEVRNLVGGDSLDSSSKISERKNFEPTALFVPDLTTDENGEASYKVVLPDSLTAYRITAVGVKENKFSLAESQIDVANPVSVRPVLPQVLRINDESEVGVTISNISNSVCSLDISLGIYNGTEYIDKDREDDGTVRKPGKAMPTGNFAKAIKVDSGKTDTLMFSMKALQPGWVTVEFVITGDLLTERLLLPLEIKKPYVYETVTSIGQVLDSNQAHEDKDSESVIFPKDIDDGMINFYVQLDGTRLGTLRESVDYLFRYPYGCLEQRSSAILPLIVFSDYIKIFGLDSEVKNPKKVVKKELANIEKYQNSNGGFSYWPDYGYSNPYVSSRIAEILAIAIDKGIGTNASISNLSRYLILEADKTIKSKYNYSDYDAAHFLYAASMLGAEIRNSTVESLIKKDSDVSTLALCGLIYLNGKNTSKAEAVAKRIRNVTKITTRGIDIAETKFNNYWSFFNDSSEKYALALQLFSRLDPKDEINGRLVYELLNLQKVSKGYWKSTSATARVLTAMNDYITLNKLTDINFTAEALLGGNKILSGNFKGLGADPVEKVLDKEALDIYPREQEIPLEFTRKGKGDLFYTISMKYALPADKQTARDEGISVTTEIIDVKTGKTVSNSELEAGKVYKQKIFVSTTKNRTFVALRAPVPAGAVILNAAFATTGTIPDNRSAKSSDYDYDEDDYSQINYGLSYRGIYEDEVQYFWNYFPKGNQQVEFMFRAGRKGTFNTPSIMAECMYQEEIFGRSCGKIWKIK